MAKGILRRAQLSKYGRRSKNKTLSERAPTGRNGERLPAGFSRKKSIKELAAEQGVRLEGQLERIWGSGAHLWESDEEFERFVRDIYDRRRQDRELSKR